MSYECAIFNDYTGTLYAKGRFIPTHKPGENLTFRAYDGMGLISMSDTSWLQAQDTVDFPFGDGHGKRIKFNAGKALEPETTY